MRTESAEPPFPFPMQLKRRSNKMKVRGYQLGITIGLGALLVFSSCKQTGTPGGTSTLSLKRISVPSRVFTIAGEALAFEALGAAGHSGETSISLRRLQSRCGKFDNE